MTSDPLWDLRHVMFSSCYMAGCCLCLVPNAEILLTNLDTCHVGTLIHGFKSNFLKKEFLRNFSTLA